MSTDWKPERLKKASISPRTAKYEGIPANHKEKAMKELYPEIFIFNAISIGDERGQAFIVPLDESSRKTAEYILRAIKSYGGD